MSGAISPKTQALNAFLRALPMAAKLLLTLYMGRCLSLAEMGVYGLAFGAVTILLTVQGQGFGYLVARDIVGVSPFVALHKMRDQAVLLAANYVVMGLAAALLISNDILPIAPGIVWLVVALTALEGCATTLYSNANSLNQQLAANFFFFMRVAVAALPPVILGLFSPQWRSAEIALSSWAIGSALSVGANLWFWRDMPWRKVLLAPIDWRWLSRGVAKCLPIWFGGMGFTASLVIDRFVVEHFLTLDDVGVLTFYYSFVNALMNLLQSGVFAFSLPRVIALHRDADRDAFWREANRATRQVALLAGFMALILAVAVPLLGVMVGRAALSDNAPTLWLMLFGVWMRLIAEAFNNVLYARHQDRAIWLGNLLSLVPAIGGNALLVPLAGLPGAGVAACLSAAFLLGWRWRWIGEHGWTRTLKSFQHH
jgi:O-antigen/teichoic acid export membrane protein